MTNNVKVKTIPREKGKEGQREKKCIQNSKLSQKHQLKY